MSKFSTYAKRGSAAEFGTMAGPSTADWTISSPVAGQFSAGRIGGIPPPATQWAILSKSPAGVIVQTAPTSGTPITGAATTGQTYSFQAAWFDNVARQLSPWSAPKTQVIT
jgi:hypothetical protein